ncbi:hypothetical protein Pla110_35930 [Polystyrenella longa]|uniref:Uncharacterized protein n=1 Tax=Polystyrenella longa TaxID=2528007 RepID=A0A518CRI9_9PLAN|nr:hypothetical protein [Polystyrenella longa]QDU81842.1 hypothetical protein Pla110_35930 [Polystyrenella longa]
MVIRFRCFHCQHLFGIDEEAADTDLDCPACGHTLHVPRRDGFSSPSRITHPARDQKLLAACETLAHQPQTSVKPPRPTTKPSLKQALQLLSQVPPSKSALSEPLRKAEQPARQAPVHSRVRRWVGIAFIYLTTMALGYYGGINVEERTPANLLPPALAEVAVPNRVLQQKKQLNVEPVEVSGRIRYRAESGQFQADAGAMLFLFPESNSNSSLLSGELLSLNEDNIAEASIRQQLLEMGGALAVTDSEGGYVFTVKEPGNYHALILSEETDRTGPKSLPPEWHETLSQYLAAPEKLAVERRVHLQLIEIKPGQSRVFDVDLERS